jgi:hypothetical protein
MPSLTRRDQIDGTTRAGYGAAAPDEKARASLATVAVSIAISVAKSVAKAVAMPAAGRYLSH